MHPAHMQVRTSSGRRGRGSDRKPGSGVSGRGQGSVLSFHLQVLPHPGGAAPRSGDGRPNAILAATAAVATTTNTENLLLFIVIRLYICIDFYYYYYYTLIIGPCDGQVNNKLFFNVAFKSYE